MLLTNTSTKSPWTPSFTVDECKRGDTFLSKTSSFLAKNNVPCKFSLNIEELNYSHSSPWMIFNSLTPRVYRSFLISKRQEYVAFVSLSSLDCKKLTCKLCNLHLETFLYFLHSLLDNWGIFSVNFHFNYINWTQFEISRFKRFFVAAKLSENP